MGTDQQVETELPEHKQNLLLDSCKGIQKKRQQLFATVQAEALGRDDISLALASFPSQAQIGQMALFKANFITLISKKDCSNSE